MATPVIPVELIEQVSKRGCVLFLGWSYSSPKPGILTDKLLAQKLSERVGFYDPSKTLAEVAEYFEAQRGTNALNQFVYDIIASYDKPPAFYNGLLRLPFNIVVSTSLDNYEKRVLHDMGEKLHYVIRDEEIPFIENDKEARIVVKLYGDIDNRSSMVITKEQLIGFFDRLPSISDLLKYYFSTMTLVFIGFNLDDPHFSQLYAYTNQRTKGYQKRAFAVVPGVNEYQKTIWGKKNLNILDIDIDLFVDELENSIVSYPISKREFVPQLETKTPKGFKTPYKFLNSFDEDDVDIFFGRDREINQALHKLLSSKLMIVYGKSGYGKTSLIKAGIIPRLLAGDFLPIYTRCSIDPLLSVKASIIDRLGDLATSTATINRFSEFTKLSLRKFIVELYKIQSRRLVIFIDQFEEFFISLGDETKKQFVRELGECVDSSLDVTFLLSLREDFLGDLQDIKSFRSFIGDSYRLKALGTQAAQDAIEEPAKKFGLSVESKVVDNIINELADKGQVDPAQLQIVCDRLYNRLPESSNEINETLYNDLGGVKQILTDYLDEILFDFGTKRMTVAHKILRNMVTSWFTRIPITYAEAALSASDVPEWSELDTKELLSDLIKVRLIRRIVETSDESYELTHEFLINKIREWIDLEQLKVKEALDLLRQELNNWQRHQIPMDKSKLAIIGSQREKLMLDNKHKAFVLIAATQYDVEFEYWLKRNDGNPLAVEHLDRLLLTSTSNFTKNLAGLGVSAFSREEKAINDVLHTYESVANPNTINRMHALEKQSFSFPVDFEKKVELLVRERFTKNMALVPNGKFIFGTHKEKIVEYINGIPDPDKRPPLSFFDGQYPQKEIELDEFLIDKYLVTNAEYQEFKPEHTFESGKENHPAVGVSYYDALEYAQWLGKDLPTEEDWEKAARGSDGRDFPWGNQWKSKEEGGFDVCNTSNTGHEGTTPVDMFPAGVSPFGCYDMAGNVWEWTTTSAEKDYKVLRGGSWSRYSLLPWCWYRFSYKPDQGYPNVGFRCMKRSEKRA
ncbi:MAG: SUMF1/EgtB/PvdO family nonheme iron enzyme [Chloroflexota bacterium]